MQAVRPLIEQLTPGARRAGRRARIWTTSRALLRVRSRSPATAWAGVWAGASPSPIRIASSALASFHGGGLVTDAADSPHLISRPPEGRAVLRSCRSGPQHDRRSRSPRWSGRSTMRAWRYRSELYAGALHGYTMADTAAYDEAAVTSDTSQRCSHCSAGRSSLSDTRPSGCAAQRDEGGWLTAGVLDVGAAADPPLAASDVAAGAGDVVAGARGCGRRRGRRGHRRRGRRDGAQRSYIHRLYRRLAYRGASSRR